MLASNTVNEKIFRKGTGNTEPVFAIIKNRILYGRKRTKFFGKAEIM